MRNRMKSFTLAFLCVCSNYIFSQQDTSLTRHDNTHQGSNLYDSICFKENQSVKNIVGISGYFLSYFYTTGDKLHNFNIIFIPESRLTNPIINAVTEKSSIINKGKPFHEHYLLSKNNIADFENIFKYCWVVKQTSKAIEKDSMSRIIGYLKTYLGVINGELYTFRSPGNETEINDSIGIVYTLIEAKAILKLEPYNYSSQKKHFEIICGISDYDCFNDSTRYIKIHIYNKLRRCKLDDRFISPIITEVLAVELEDKGRRKVSKRYIPFFKGDEKRKRYHSKL